MIKLKERYVVDEKGNRVGVLLDLEDYQKLLEELEELESIRAYDTARASGDEAILFDIINNFSIRHHNPQQKTNYDRDIWYSWMFHFYLATYHAAIRIIKRTEREQ